MLMPWHVDRRGRICRPLIAWDRLILLACAFFMGVTLGGGL